MFDAVWRKLFGSKAPPPVPDIRYRELAENSSDMICRIGGDGSAKYFSPASLTLFGWTPQEMREMDPAGFFYAEDLPILHAATARLYDGTSTDEVCEVRAMRRDGSSAWVETRTRIAPASDPGERGDLIVVLRDISERKRMEEQLAQLALQDGLTGVANRRAFDARLDEAWRGAVARGSHLTLLLLDIDHFKRFNDRFGHQVGDDCLRAVASTMVKAVSDMEALVARFGGEEFAIILPEAGPAEAAPIAEAVRAAVYALTLPHPDNGEDVPFVSVSVGAATALAREGGTVAMPTGLIQAADLALYKAKNGGRNRIEQSLVLTAPG